MNGDVKWKAMAGLGTVIALPGAVVDLKFAKGAALGFHRATTALGNVRNRRRARRIAASNARGRRLCPSTNISAMRSLETQLSQ